MVFAWDVMELYLDFNAFWANNDMINDNPYTDVGRFLPDIFKTKEL